MDKFYIITNSAKDKNQEFTNEIVKYLRDHGRQCQVQLAERKKRRRLSLDKSGSDTRRYSVPSGTWRRRNTSPGCQRRGAQRNSDAWNQSGYTGISC